MQLNVGWLYPDLLDLYGDRGNILCIQKRCAWRNIDIHVTSYSLGDEFSLKDLDMIFIGGGSDREQNIIYEDLLKRKQELIECIEEGLVVLAICGGYQLLGKYYKDAQENIVEGLGIFDFYTEASSLRMIGDIAIETKMQDKKYIFVGFENHGGATLGHSMALGKVLKGFGNNGKDGFEGIHYKNVFGTYMHGPLLPKNPELTDILIQKMMERRDPQFQLPPLNNDLELRAKQAMLKKLNVHF